MIDKKKKIVIDKKKNLFVFLKKKKINGWYEKNLRV